LGGQLCANARSPARIRCDGRSEDNAFRLDEVFKKFDLENVAATGGNCASLAKDILRSSAAYVRENPVRAGLVNTADEWKFMGEIFRLEYRSD
jgi:hypothetical protein